MATIEIDEAELQRLNTLRTTVATLLKHPVAKLKIQEAVKLQYPDAATPELDATMSQYKSEQEMTNRISELEKKISDDAAKRDNDERTKAFAARIEEGFSNLKRDGWTDAGISEVRKIMEEKGITDHAIAAAYYEKLHPPQELIQPNGRGGWNFMDAINPDEDKDLQKLIESKGENAGLIDKMARDALNEVRTAARR